jgi:hypothetical protein
MVSQTLHCKGVNRKLTISGTLRLYERDIPIRFYVSVY